jgi:hypothetical protein
MTQWVPSYAKVDLYGSMLMRARQASQFGTIKGLLWYQGESESWDRNNIIYYSQRVHTLWQAIRADLGLPDLPIVFVKLGPKPDSRWTDWDDLKAWQQSIADTQPPNVAMADASDLHALPAPQNNHLDFNSQVILGGRLADAMYQIMP